MKHRMLITAASLLCAGVTLADAAQNDQNTERNRPGNAGDRARDTNRQTGADRNDGTNRGMDRGTMRFVSQKEILGATVVSPMDDDEKAELDNLVVDTRNGHVAYAIIDTNGILDSENKVVAVPFGALSWNPQTEQFTLNATPGQMQALPQIDPKDLSRLNDAAWHGKMKGIFHDHPELQSMRDARGDEYSPRFSRGKVETFDGTIVSRRDMKSMHGAPMQAVVIRRSDTGVEQVVILGPSDYISSENITFKDGDTVTVWTVPGRDYSGSQVAVASSFKHNDRTYRLRDDQGMPSWTGHRSSSAADGSAAGENAAGQSNDDAARRRESERTRDIDRKRERDHNNDARHRDGGASGNSSGSNSNNNTADPTTKRSSSPADGSAAGENAAGQTGGNTNPGAVDDGHKGDKRDGHNHDGHMHDDRVHDGADDRHDDRGRSMAEDKSTTRAWSTTGAHYVLASRLDDGDLYAQGDEKWGDVTDILYEVNSGNAAYAVVSVGGAMGVGDTLYAVPISALMFGANDRLYVDMPVSRLQTAPQLSKDWNSDLGNAQFTQRTWDYYGVQTPRYETDRSRRWTDHTRANVNDRDDMNP